MSSPSWPTLKDVFKARRIVVTGATGYVGKVWVSWMLSHFPDLEQLVLLIRPKTDQTAAERFTEVVATSPVFRPLREQHGARLPHRLRRQGHPADVVVRRHVRPHRHVVVLRRDAAALQQRVPHRRARARRADDDDAGAHDELSGERENSSHLRSYSHLLRFLR